MAFTAVGVMETFFQCVAMMCELTDEVKQPWLAAQKVFHTPAEVYVPHVSLLYSHVPVEER